MIHADQLKAFVAFGETLNFTRAAERLHVSQPALHVQIRKLSESLGVPLYARRGRALELTAQGKALLAFGRDQAERTAALRAQLKLEAHEETLVLAAGEGALLYLLGPALAAFQRRPRARLRVVTRDRDAAVAAVQLGEAHLAVTAIDDVPDDLIARRIARVGTAVILPRAHRLAHKRSITLPALDREPLIVPAQGRPLRAALANACAAAGIRFTPTIETNGWPLMLRFAELGLGLAIVNDFCPPPRNCVRRPLHGMPVSSYQLLRPRARLQTPASLALEHALLQTS